MKTEWFTYEGRILNFPKKKLDIDSILNKTIDDFSSQENIETFINDKIKMLNKKGSINNNKFATPTLLSQYEDISTIESIVLSIPYSNKVKDISKIEEFAIDYLQKHYSEIEKAIKEHINNVKELFDIAKSAPAPYYAEKSIKYEIYQWQNYLIKMKQFKQK